ncbi:hypothetical protein DNTS_000486 [Danionella cerebrum]|uniref:Myosin tail domain-containing protein n=1 Tax=Danionella cerebrum TaxID=2873325 RepID=A0A553R4T2_9TELE|nr:hypothetical protein DNTS_000486 [Danionella translucida]
MSSTRLARKTEPLIQNQPVREWAESVTIRGMPNAGISQAYAQPPRTRGQSNGTYGLSIRVQGIDGHPYVVLNNQDRGPNPYAVPPGNNGYLGPEKPLNYDEFDYKDSRNNLSEGQYMDFISPKQHGGPQNGAFDPKKQPSLLNFQKHPEILKPYDPESNTLDGFRSLPLVEPRNPYPASLPRANSPAVSQARSSPLIPDPDDRGHAQPQARPQMLNFQPQRGPTKDQVLSQARVKSQVQAQPQVKAPFKSTVPNQTHSLPSQRLPVPQPSTMPNNPSDQSKPSSRPPSSVGSANSSLERSRLEPDVLRLHSVDSSGPVMQASSSRKSSVGSTTPTREDQLDQLFAETINRHENRRYIPFLPGTGRDIDTGSIPGVDELIKKFDSKETQQRRGRSGRRNRINPEDRKRSRSVDSALPFGLEGDSDYLDEVSRNRGRSTEHVLRPSLILQKTTGVKTSPTSTTYTPGPRINLRNTTQVKSAPGSPQGTVSNSLSAIFGEKRDPSLTPMENKPEEIKTSQSAKCLSNVKTESISRPSVNIKSSTSEVEAQVTPDLLKGQQEISQQTNEETAKQILFSYLKDGSNDTDDTTKRKVNLVFEKIQTLKSRAAGNVQADNKSPDLAAQAKALQEQKSELEKEIADLKKQLEHENKKHSDLDGSRPKPGAGVNNWKKELEQSQAETSRLRDKLSTTENDLCTTLEELYQVKMEKEQYQTEIRDLQDQLSEMHDELDGAKQSQTESADKEDFMQLQQDLQDLLVAKEDQEDVLRRRERELTALKGALKDEVATHDQEVDRLREQYEKEIRKLQSTVEEAKQNNVATNKEKEEVEAARKLSENQAGHLAQEMDRLRQRVQELEGEVTKLNHIINEGKLQESRLLERARLHENEKRELEESLAEVREQEEEMTRANRALATRLEDVQERLKEEKSQKEQFKNTKNEIEDERRLLDRTVEKLQREMNDIVEASQSSTQELQEQIDMYKEKNRREMAELQKQLREGGLELEKSRLIARNLQEELAGLQEDLRQCQKERDEALKTVKSLQQTVFDLEVETETKAHSNDKTRQVKVLELEQMRNELMQERASRQDVECDKISLERQNKDLKSRIAYLEGSHKPSKEGLVAQLEKRIQELEERLEGEERERSNLQIANRRLERKVKEMMMQVDEEHHSLQDQKDQLNLRLKALKRQMDEAEEEIDRLEHSKKKLQRDLEEQHEANEQLQSQLKTLRTEIRRKNNTAPILNADDDDDDDISTDGETYFSSSSGYKRSSSQDAIISNFSM